MRAARIRIDEINSMMVGRRGTNSRSLWHDSLRIPSLGKDLFRTFSFVKFSNNIISCEHQRSPTFKKYWHFHVVLTTSEKRWTCVEIDKNYGFSANRKDQCKQTPHTHTNPNTILWVLHQSAVLQIPTYLLTCTQRIENYAYYTFSSRSQSCLFTLGIIICGQTIIF